jgi:RNA polymerase sigma factor (sigma-70 family)
VYYIDELILREIRNRNERVLFDVYKTNFPMIQRLILSNSGTEQEAKDIYQDAVISFYERVHQPDFQLTCRISTYLYAVSRRLWLKRLAEKKVTGIRIEDVEPFFQVEDEFEKIDENARHLKSMEQSLNQLGQPCSDIIVDFYYNDLSMDQITLKYGYTNADNAKNQKYKCLQRLRKLFFDDVKKKL